MGCGGCGKAKKVSRVAIAGRSSSLNMSDLVRVEYLGKNLGPIPFRAPSGQVYRVSNRTYRFVDVLPEDVDFLVKSGKFRRVVRTVSKVAETVQTIVDTTLKDKTVSEPVETVTEQVFEPLQEVDLTTVETVKKSLDENNLSVLALNIALSYEQESEKPRKTVLELLENAIENHPDNSGSL